MKETPYPLWLECCFGFGTVKDNTVHGQHNDQLNLMDSVIPTDMPLKKDMICADFEVMVERQAGGE